MVLFGGQSAEHDVSRATAAHVMRAADPSRYRVHPVGITREGRWVLAGDAARAQLEQMNEVPAGTAVGPAIASGLAVVGPETEPLPALSFDSTATTVVLPLLHGPMGEDGTVQGLLELAGVAYAGCGVLSSAVAMDKAMAKQVLAHNGIPQARWLAFAQYHLGPDTAAAIVAELGLPCFVKPANMGSSVGVSKAHTLADIDAAIELALGYDEWIVVEEAILGREIEVAVIGNAEPRASVPGEIVPGHEFYDFDDKYLDDGAKLMVPAPLDSVEAETVRRLAIEAFTALRCEGLARVDFFYEEGGRGFLCNEANTMPGFTPISMYPKLWQASGVSYGELIDELVSLALERHARRRRNTVR